MSLTGSPDGPPLPGRAPRSRTCGGHDRVPGHRPRAPAPAATGEGGRVDVSLLESLLPTFAYHASTYLLTGKVPAPPRATAIRAWPPTRPSRPRTARHRAAWAARRCGGRSAPRWGSRRSRRSALRDQRPARHQLSDASAPSSPRGCGRGRSANGWPVGERRASPAAACGRWRRRWTIPQVAARGLLVDVDHPVAGPRPIRRAAPSISARCRRSSRRPPPVLGQHTEEVLRERLGLGSGEVAALREQGVI